MFKFLRGGSNKTPAPAAKLLGSGAQPIAQPPAAPRVTVSRALQIQVPDSVPVGGTAAIGQLQASVAADPRAPIVVDVRDLPGNAVLVSETHGELALAPEVQRTMAFLRVGKQKVLLVVSTDIWTSGRMYSQRQRARRDAGVDVEFVRASREVVEVCYTHFSPEPATAKIGDREDTEVEKRAFFLVDEAVKAGASDIHIEARQGHAEILIRVDGFRRRLEALPSLSFSQAESIGRVLYNVHADASSKDTAWDPKRVQDAVVEHQTRDGQHVQLRFNSGPIFPSGSFQIVIRILRMNQSQTFKLESMGYTDSQMRQIEVALAGSRGLVLMCGPMGSGKSTALQAMITRVYERRGVGIKIVTVEDPVEYVIPHACQMGVPQKSRRGTGVDGQFDEFLKGTLRQDADVVMVGEIRNAESAEVVKDLVLVGRKIFTTLHAYSSIQAYLRLREIGVPWDVLTNPGFVSGVVFQRLLPVLCPSCSVPFLEGAASVAEDVRARLKLVADLVEDNIRVRGDGCEHCGRTGYKGRVAVAEVLLPDATLLELLKKDDLVAAQQYWLRKGAEDAVARMANGETWVAKYPTALAHAIIAMRKGYVDPSDVEANIDILTEDDAAVGAWGSSAKVYQGGMGSALQRRASRVS